MATDFSTMTSPARKGVVRTQGAPRFGAQPGGIGAVEDSLPPYDPTLTPPGSPGSAGSGSGFAGRVQSRNHDHGHDQVRDHEAHAQVRTSAQAPAPAKPPEVPSALARAYDPVEGPFARRTRLEREARELAAAQQAAPRVYEASESLKNSPFASRILDGDRPEVRAGRRDIHATKIVARLVAAIARKPGSGVPNAIKHKHLGELLSAVRDAASRIVASIAPTDAHRGWVQASATEAALTLVTTQWENDPVQEMRPIDVQIDALEAVFRAASDDEKLGAAIDDLGEARFVEAQTPEIARAKVLLSARLASWDLYTSIMNPVLGKGTFRYTYDLNASEIVERLMPELYAIARDNNVRTDSLDLRTMHMQGSLRRLADLMGAEYVTRTRAVMNWIAEEGISDDEYQSRLDKARVDFDVRLVPELVEWTRRNFVAVETMASRLMEEPTNEQPDVQRHA